MLSPDQIQEHATHADAGVREYRIFGPPGTGKTTNLSRQVRRAAERFGDNAVLVTSFSKTAAAELAGRDLPIDPSRIGTLHSHCWHALGGPEIAEANVGEWNRDNPSLRITQSKRQHKLDCEEASAVVDDTATALDGDERLAQLNRFRGMMIPREVWPTALREFGAKWAAYKDSLGLLDFTDLISTAMTDTWAAPGHPRVIFADEAQDLNRLQLTLIRRWGEHCDHFILAGDDDQLLYPWTGCTPEALLEPELPSEHVIVLKQSYRVPRAVHAEADKLIRQVTRRQQKEYLPRDAEGSVQRLARGGWKSPEYFILKTTLEHLDRGQTVMFLAPCAYMLKPFIKVLSMNGIPFHNPYRLSNGAWNPLASRGPGSASNRVLALLAAHPVMGDDARPWTFGDVKLWCEWLTSQGVLRRGAKKQVAAAGEDRPAKIEDLDLIFEPAALDSLLDTFEGDYRKILEWWQARVGATHRDRTRFPVSVASLRGPQALLREPQVTVGTIHSVKGGEADVIMLIPDVSAAGQAAYLRDGATRDSMIRLFYVGLTRARETLYICARESAMAVRL